MSHHWGPIWGYVPAGPLAGAEGDPPPVGVVGTGVVGATVVGATVVGFVAGLVVFLAVGFTIGFVADPVPLRVGVTATKPPGAWLCGAVGLA